MNLRSTRHFRCKQRLVCHEFVKNEDVKNAQFKV